jgi:hypothetical protein
LLAAQVIEYDALEDLIEGDPVEGEALQVPQLGQVGAELPVGVLAGEGQVAQAHSREAGGGCLEEPGQEGVRVVVVAEKVKAEGGEGGGY